MHFRPTDDNVLVVLDRVLETQTASGLHLPPVEVSPIEAKLATVLAVGPGVPMTERMFPRRRAHPCDASPTVGRGWVPMQTAPGMRVLLGSKDAGDKVPVETLLSLGLDPERHYRIVREAEIDGELLPSA